MKKVFLPLATAVLLASCSQQADINWDVLPGSTNYVLEYGESGIPRQKKVNLREQELEQLRTYMQELVNEGNISPVTYAPATVLSGENYSLNFNRELIILNIWNEENKDGCQFTRKRTQSDDDLQELIRRRTNSRKLKR